jgi:8-oxo-dGTP diphosphatase
MTAIYIMYKNRMLLLYRVGSRVVQPSWCGIGGHFKKDELNDPKACVIRELYEETGITESDIGDVKLKYITLRQKNNEIRQNYYFFAELNSEVEIKECDEGILEWVNMNEVLDREMPISAKESMKHYISLGKDNNKVYAGITTENGINFVELEEF